MIIVGLAGGLGNQMFQFALGYRLALDRAVPLAFDVSGLHNPTIVARNFSLGVFGIKKTIAPENVIQRYRYGSLFPNRPYIHSLIDSVFPLKRKSYKQESGLGFDSSVFGLGKNVYLQGYWQSEQYFLDRESYIRKALSFTPTLQENIRDWEAKISNSHSVAVHVRRGDYVTDPKANAINGVLETKYYMRASEFLEKTIKHRTRNSSNQLEYFVFSDDLHWAQKNITFKGKTHFVETKIDYEDMRLMSLCRHQIIANSTFSWWSAWLNKNGDKIVVAPKNWFMAPLSNPDLIPNSWMQL